MNPGISDEVIGPRGMSDGILRFRCPKCGDFLEVGLHVIDAFDEQCSEAMNRVNRGYVVEFIAKAPNLHAIFWGHLVRCHQPNPHPYISATK